MFHGYAQVIMKHGKIASNEVYSLFTILKDDILVGKVSKQVNKSG